MRLDTVCVTSSGYTSSSFAEGPMQEDKPLGATFRPELGLFDFTLLVIGAIVGDGIYVVSSMGASSMGPAQLVVWAAAGVLAALIAIAFIQCATIDPEVGGSYSYARTAFGPFVGFLAGWSLYVGEWVALSAFPTAFFNYFQSFTGAADSMALPVKLTLIATVTAVNFTGVRQGARTNDALTAAKLVPLGLLAILGLVFLATNFDTASGHLRPFTPLGWQGLGDALLPIFWAYAGFELAVLPAAEVRSPQITLPRGLIIGATVATVFYLLTSLAVVVGQPWQEVAASSHPLASSMRAMLGALGGPAEAGGRLMSLGGLISIAGVCLVFTLGLARLSYSLAVDGLLPSSFAKLHGRFRTPYFGLLFQAGSAIVFSTLLDLRFLLSTAVFFLSICYLLTSLSALRLVQKQPERALHLPSLPVLLGLAALSSIFLAAQASLVQLGAGVGVLLAGACMYALHGRVNEDRPALPAMAPHLIRPSPEHHSHFWLWRAVKRR